MKKVLVVVDYQNDFVNGSLGFLQSENIATEIYSLVVKAARNKDLIIFTKDTHYENYLSTREGKFLPVEHCIKGTDGHRLYGELAVFEFAKPRCIFVSSEHQLDKASEAKLFTECACGRSRNDHAKAHGKRENESDNSFHSISPFSRITKPL